MPLKKKLNFLLLVILAFILISFAIANQTIVFVHISPFPIEPFNIALSAPLWLWMFGPLAIGLLWGIFYSRIYSWKYKKELKSLQKRLNLLELQRQNLYDKSTESS